MLGRRWTSGVAVALSLGFAGVAQAQLPHTSFTPIPPCRIIDTRCPSGSTCTPFQLSHTAGSPHGFIVHGPSTDYRSQGGQASGCGIPDLLGARNSAKAIAVNLIAVGATAPGDLRAWPGDQPVPASSVINFSALAANGGLNVANGVILPLCDAIANCPSGDILFRADAGDAFLVADVTGYFTDSTPTLFGQFGGNGSDGGIDVTGSVALGISRLQLTDLTVEVSGTLSTTQPMTSIAVQGRCTIHGTLSARSGAPGGQGGSNLGGSPGRNGDLDTAPPTGHTLASCGGGPGGAGGNDGFAGGVGGDASGPGLSPLLSTLTGFTSSGAGTTTGSQFALLLGCTGGGAGGGAAMSGVGGTGGTGGSVLYMECGELDLSPGGAVIDASGQDGAPPVSGGMASGGGGGGGGVVLIRTRKIVASTGSVKVGGGMGMPGVGTGGPGQPGKPGIWDIILTP